MSDPKEREEGDDQEQEGEQQPQQEPPQSPPQQQPPEPQRAKLRQAARFVSDYAEDLLPPKYRVAVDALLTEWATDTQVYTPSREREETTRMRPRHG